MLLRNLKIWDGVSDGYLEADCLRIENGLITGIGRIPDEPGATDMGGAAAIPGLIDAHIHLCLDPDVRDPLAHGKLTADETLTQMYVRAEAMISAGITTARDLGGGRWLEMRVRDAIARGERPGPRLLCAGQPITRPDGHCHFWGGTASTTDEVLKVLERQVRRGADLIKVMATGGAMTPKSRPVDSQFDFPTLESIKRAAREHDLHVAAHCHGTAGIRDAVRAEIDTIEHCSWVGESGWGEDYDEEVAAEIAARGIRVSPTVSVNWGKRTETDFGARMKKNFAAMKAAGVQFIASTDAGIPGVYHHDLPRALPVFADYAGLSPAETLRAASFDSASAIGLGAVTGRLATGLSADVLVVDGDPLANLGCLASPVEVLCRGRAVLGLVGDDRAS